MIRTSKKFIGMAAGAFMTVTEAAQAQDTRNIEFERSLFQDRIEKCEGVISDVVTDSAASKSQLQECAFSLLAGTVYYAEERAKAVPSTFPFNGSFYGHDDYRKECITDLNVIDIAPLQQSDANMRDVRRVANQTAQEAWQCLNFVKTVEAATPFDTRTNTPWVQSAQEIGSCVGAAAYFNDPAYGDQRIIDQYECKRIWANRFDQPVTKARPRPLIRDI